MKKQPDGKGFTQHGQEILTATEMSDRYLAWRERIDEIKKWIAERITVGEPEEVTWSRTAENEAFFTRRFDILCERANLDMPNPIRKKILDQVLHDVFGLGPIQPLIDDPEVSEVMVNAADQVWAERSGLLERVPISFRDDEHIMKIARRIIGPLGRTVNRSQPHVDARLLDGSRVNIIIPPCAIDGPTITIRKFPTAPLTADALIKSGSLSVPATEFLEACVDSAVNIIISGGTGSGKTTILNVLSSFIPENERIVTIEDAAELQLFQPHVVRLETAPAITDGTGKVTIRELLINCLRMRPDRIVIGECRGGEALDMLQAMNTGHDGSMTTIHANSPRDCIARLETLCLMAGLELPILVVRQQIASAVDLIVHIARLRDGSRKILQVTEVQGMEGDTVVMQDLFLYQAPPFEGGGTGKLQSTGIRPRFMPRLQEMGHNLGTGVFGLPDISLGRRR